MPKTATKSPVADQVRQFTGCRCKDLKNLSARCVETLLREDSDLTYVVQNCTKSWPSREKTTAFCSKTENGNLRVCFIKGAHKMPLVIKGKTYDQMLDELRTAARSHNIRVELN